MATGKKSPLVLGALCVSILLAIGGLAIWCTLPGGSLAVSVREDTTRLLGPLNDDGTVDYVAAANEIRSRGVTRENNAAVLLLQALGPEAVELHARQQVFSELGIEDALPENKHFKLWSPPLGDQDDPLYSEALAEAPWTNEQSPQFAAWLASNEQALDLAVAASERMRFFVPWVARSKPPQVVESWTLTGKAPRQLLAALACRAMNKLGNGNPAEAWKDSLALHRLGRLFAQDSTIVFTLMGIVSENRACRVDHAISRSETLGAKQSKRMLGELEALDDWPTIQPMIELDARFLLLDMSMIVIRSRSASSIAEKAAAGINVRRINADRMLQYVNAWCDKLADGAALATYHQRYQALASTGEEFNYEVKSRAERIRSWQGRITHLLKGPQGRSDETAESLGDVILAIGLPAAAGFEQARAEAIAHLRLAEIALALHAFHASHARYPASLDQLCPVYFEKLPLDPFTDKGMVYRLEGEDYVLYSVGRDEKDDDGAVKDPQAPWDQPPDIVFRSNASNP